MKMLFAGLILLVTFPAVVGSAAATIATAPHPTPAVRLFSWRMAGARGGRPTTATSPGTATPATGSGTLLHRDSTPSPRPPSARSPSFGRAQATASSATSR